MSYIYFIKSATTNLIKIGRTSGEPETRLKALCTSSPDNLSLLGFIDEGKSGHTEGSLHDKFLSKRIRGEWFEADAELCQFIDSILANRPKLDDNKIKIKTSEDVGAAARFFRLQKGLTQSQLAQSVGASRKWICEFERGHNRAELGIVLRVFNCLGVSLETGPRNTDSTIDNILNSLKK